MITGHADGLSESEVGNFHHREFAAVLTINVHLVIFIEEKADDRNFIISRE